MLRLEGRGLRQDKEEALQWFLKSAYQKNIQACYTVCNIYLKSQHEVEKSTEKGLKLLEFAAKNGSMEAQVELGKYHSDTKKEYHDLSKSILYYDMAVDSGNKNTSYTLAEIYLNGNDTPKYYIKIYSLFKQSEDKGLHWTKDLFENPISVLQSIKDCSEIMSMFIEVTTRGIDDLHYNIGYLYEHGVQRNKKYIFDIDYASAGEWYLAASNKSDSRADYHLGVMYECGKHFKSDIVTVIKCYNKASIDGNADATYRLGCSVTQNLLKAFNLFTKESTMENATEEGYIRLQYQLGLMYEKDKDYQRAFKWLSLAANIRVTDAYYRLGVFYEEGRGVDQDYVMAANMYQKAAEKEYEDACYRLGQLYQYGNGAEVDYLKAYQLYKKAADMGHIEAHKILNITLKSRIMPNVDTKEKYSYGKLLVQKVSS